MDKLRPYIDLIESFLSNQIDALKFESAYLKLFKNDASGWSGAEYNSLNDLFGDVDSFCADPKLRDTGDLDEAQLRQSARLALERLSAQGNR